MENHTGDRISSDEEDTDGGAAFFFHQSTVQAKYVQSPRQLIPSVQNEQILGYSISHTQYDDLCGKDFTISDGLKYIYDTHLQCVMTGDRNGK